jgi:hypothetical protein
MAWEGPRFLLHWSGGVARRRLPLVLLQVTAAVRKNNRAGGSVVFLIV